MICPVLVVDDDPDLRDSLMRLLEDEGYETLGASNGREALEVLERPAGRPCLILLDLMMPVMNGWETIEHLAAHPELGRIPIAIMSACNTPQRQSNMGAIDELTFLFLRKPIEIQALLDVVAEKCPRVGHPREHS